MNHILVPSSKPFFFTCTSILNNNNNETFPRLSWFPQKQKPRSFANHLNINPSNEKQLPLAHLHTLPSQIHPSQYSSLIQSSIDSKSIESGKYIHAHMLSNGFNPDTFLQTKLLMLYARCGDLSEARQMFDKMPERNSTAWNTMILAYARDKDFNEVLELFLRMQKSGIPPDKFTFPSVAKACFGLEDACGVSQIHASILRGGLNSNHSVGSVLVEGYAKFGSMDDAVKALDEICGTNVVTWNAVIGGYVQLAKWEEAWAAFGKMQTSDSSPDHFTLATVIKTCAALRSKHRGQQVHARLIVCGFHADVFVGNSLIDMYTKFGEGESGSRVFDTMRERDQVSWNSMISGYAQLGSFDEALSLFMRMQRSGFDSDRFNLGSILMACAGLGAVETGRELHSYLIRRSLDSDTILGSALVDMYSKTSCVEEASRVFNLLDDRNAVSWNALIAGYVQDGQAEEALRLYHEMKLTSTKPDQFTMASLLILSADQGIENHGKQIHARVIKTIAGHHIILETALVGMYAKCGRLEQAQVVFNRMRRRNAYVWNSLIIGYEQHNQPEQALGVFHRMQSTGIKPDGFSLSSILSACVSLSDLAKGKQVHGYILRNAFEEHEILRCTLMDMYSKCERIEDAEKVFDRINKKDVIVNNMMISAFISCNKINEAKCIFDRMDERSIVSWNVMLSGYSRNGFGHEAFELFQKMQEEESVEFNRSTLVTMFDLCASLAALGQGKQLHPCMIKKGFKQEMILDSALVDMYAKSGDIEGARKLFEKMSERNVVSWNAMINAYAKHGFGREAILLFDQMKKESINPNEITFLSVLSACSHTGLIEQGLSIFHSMLKEHGIAPKAEHYNCIVDLLGRAGRLDDAMGVIQEMSVEPDVSTWGALLASSRVHKDVEFGRLAAEKLFELDGNNPGHYVLLSNIYAAEGKWDEVKKVRKLMEAKDVIKDPGISWIEIDKVVHTFYAGDSSHSRTEEIYATLECLSWRMKGMGYVPNTNCSS